MGLLSAICTALLILSGCHAISGKSAKNQASGSWAEQMALAVMQRSDSLIRYNNPKSVKWQYDIAFLGQAIDRLGYLNPAYSAYMQSYMDYFISEDGKIKTYKLEDYNLDNINPGKNLITLYKRTASEKYHIALLQLIQQLTNQPRTLSGGFWHKKAYPWQMWLDGIYMSSPFMAQYAREFNDNKWFDTVFHQITLIYSKTLDPSTGLLYHAWDESKSQMWCNPETGTSRIFWSRGIGWFTMALVDVLDYVPENYQGRDSLIRIFRSVCTALLKVRDPEKMVWFQVVDQPGKTGNYAEASGSCMFTYAFAKGAKKGYLPQKFYREALKSFRGIVREFIITGIDGLPSLTHICGSCGLGGNPYRDGSYTYYVSEQQVDNDPKGVAPFILAAIELNQ